MAERVLAGGLVVNGDATHEADVLIEAGRVAALAASGRGGGDETIDVRGCYVLPGGVDPHTHLLADVGPASRSAAIGGTTTAVSFTAPHPGEAPARALERARDDLLPLSTIDVALHAAIWEPDRLSKSDLEGVSALGATGVKLFLAYPELGMMASDRVLYETLRDAAALGLAVLVHCESGAVIAALVDEFLATGRDEARHFSETRPPEAETEAVDRTLAVAAFARSPVYLVHLSTVGSLAAVRQARRQGIAACAEACIHHLVLDESVHERGDTERFLVVPPLRAREHVEALWQGIQAGTIDTVGSDHAQVRYRPQGRPPGDFTSLPYGLAGVEARLPLLLSLGRAHGVPLERLVRLASTTPAKTFGLYPRKGAIVPGADADLVVWDPRAEWTMPAAICDGVESAYSGLRVRGRIRFVFRRGELVVADGELVGSARGGRYVAAERPASRGR